MAIHVALNHKTQYRYDRAVALGPQIVRLRPAPHCHTPVLSYSLKISPAKHFINWQQDPHSNYLARLVFPEPTSEFLIEVDLVVEMAIFNPFDFFLEPAAENYPFSLDASATRDLRPFLEMEPAGPLLSAFLSRVPLTTVRTIDFLMALNGRLRDEVAYVIRMEPGVQTCEQTLALRSGSCRDSAWLMVQVLRHLNLPARFVSGYLIQLAPDVKPLEGAPGPTADFTDLHAWAEVYLPGAGWIGLDPTSGLLAGEGHIPLACTPDAGAAAPVSGLIEPCQTLFHHEMSVRRVLESPRVTKPYSDSQWKAVAALGQKVESDLEAQDVRLTMGGEPTFVSLDDPDGDEWTSAALGPNKRKLAAQLFLKLRDRFAPGALLHFGQGKWYPGEPLPRWALGCYWRKDGVAIWENAKLIADEDATYSYTAADAKRFMEALTRRLQVNHSFIMTAFEDVFYYLWKERKLPVNVMPADSKLENLLDREQMARVFEQGLGKTAGYVLPLRRIPSASGHPRWTSQPWFLAAPQLFLTPGDSPMGYRLPIDSLPWTKPEDAEWSFDPDPFRDREVLPPAPERQPHLFSQPVLADEPEVPREHPKPPRKGEPSKWVSRPALCLQPRAGRLFVFMPPLEYLADYLSLVAAIEDTAVYLEIPVTIEGYTPPSHSRLAVLKVTPDPGVIEVNIQPAASWDELVRNTTDLYRLARECHLSTEKFMVDGQHAGTGGGNHIVVGGARPEDSAFLRRPDMLRSIIGFWQNHPSLSYLFSGLFIGPTSQHPRIDEARTDSLYEMQIAFNQVPDANNPNVSPWLVDRIFRNLLTDLTGNTHRAELCIDKLYPPDAASLRLGLVEMRAFEMPPHARMSLAQQLVIRALIAHFWRTPYKHGLVRWGTTLHDRFMLPHFVWLDWEDVLAELSRAGYVFAKDWYAPHFEFRFPVIGSISKHGVHLELRHALEPWNVLGEETSAGATVRNVDSSVERLQVKVSGLIDPRFVVLCNRRRVPLHPTGTKGEFVAGVRYRAWQPPSCLHPNIPVHTPLVFDILDIWSGSAIGGCTYHVAHPGGRANEEFPVNANEAESRRVARFSGTGHTTGLIDLPPEESNPDFPLTLDLRST